VDFLRSRGLIERTLLVITSDHGEEFFEHGGILHGKTQYQEVVRVPLVFRGPGIPKGLRVATPASLLDVVPTLLARLGLTVPGLDGEDLSRVLAGEPGRLAERVLFGEADHINVQPDITRAVRRGNLKLVYDRLSDRRQLFDLSRDPGETADVQGAHTEPLKLLDEQLRRFLLIRGESAAPAKLSPAEIEKLRSLGYVQ
jgi:arylsulfatase A-like enzyme